MTYAKPLFKTYNHVLPQNKWCRNSDFILSLFSTSHMSGFYLGHHKGNRILSIYRNIKRQHNFIENFKLMKL